MLLKFLHSLRKEPDKRNKNFYFKERGGIKFVFYSNVELSQEEFPKVMGIICDNVSIGISGNVTARQIQQCFEKDGVVAVDISSQDEGKGWVIKLSDNPLSFND